MLRDDFNPFTLALAIGVVLLFAFLVLKPRAEPISTLDQTEAMLSELGLQWNEPGVPVLVFASSGCPASRAFETALRRERVGYLRVDVSEDEVGREMLADLGRNRLGSVVTLATPTTVVGTEVIRGSDVEEVLEAITAQNQAE